MEDINEEADHYSMSDDDHILLQTDKNNILTNKIDVSE